MNRVQRVLTVAKRADTKVKKMLQEKELRKKQWESYAAEAKLRFIHQSWIECMLASALCGAGSRNQLTFEALARREAAHGGPATALPHPTDIADIPSMPALRRVLSSTRPEKRRALKPLLGTLNQATTQWPDAHTQSAWHARMADNMLLLLDPDVIAESRQESSAKAQLPTSSTNVLHTSLSAPCADPHGSFW